MHTEKIQNAYVLSTAAAQYEAVSSCLEKVHNSTLLLKLHKVCTDALLFISPTLPASHENRHITLQLWQKLPKRC